MSVVQFLRREREQSDIHLFLYLDRIAAAGPVLV